MGFIPNPISAIKDAAKAVGNAVKDVATKAVEAATNYVAKGIGKVIHDGLVRLGIPGPLANIVAMAFDPMHAGDHLAELVDVVGKELGVPESVRNKLKDIIKKADQYAKTFAQEGFGGVVKELGKDLGLPKELYTAIAIAVDVGTGNYAGATKSAVELATIAAEKLGIPESALDIANLGVAIARGDVNGIKKHGAEVIADGLEKVPGMPGGVKDAFQAGVHLAAGNTEAAKKEAAQLVNRIVDELPLPDAIKTLGQMGAAYYTGDKEALKQASMKLANEIVSQLDLPPAAQKLFDAGMALANGDTKAAAKALGIPEEVLNKAIQVAKNKDAYIAELKKLASDPAARKEFTDKLVDLAKEEGPKLIAKQLGIDPKYVDMAKGAWENRDAIVAFAKDLATNPEVRKEFAQIFIGETLARLGVTPEQQKLVESFLKDPVGTLDANKEAIAREALKKAGLTDQQIDTAKAYLDDPKKAIEAGKQMLAEEALKRLGISKETLGTIESFVKDPAGSAKKLGEDFAKQLGAEFGIPGNVVSDLLKGDTKSAEALAEKTIKDNLPRQLRG